jgi:hypothetical protein
MSFGDSFWLASLVFAATMPLLLLLGKGAARAGLGGPAAAPRRGTA